MSRFSLSRAALAALTVGLGAALLGHAGFAQGDDAGPGRATPSIEDGTIIYEAPERGDTERAIVPFNAENLEFVAFGDGCRALDTRRAGGRVNVGVSRVFGIFDSDIPGQGGASGGCGIPTGAMAVDMSLSTVGGSPTGNGFLKAGRAGVNPPKPTLLQFLKGQGISVTTTIPVDDGDLRVAIFGGNSHIVGDLVGYWVVPTHLTMYFDPTAEPVTSGFTAVAFGGVVDAARLEAGLYGIQFLRDVGECTIDANADFDSDAPIRMAQGFLGEFDQTIGFVEVTDAAGDRVDSGFNLSLTC